MDRRTSLSQISWKLTISNSRNGLTRPQQAARLNRCVHGFSIAAATEFEREERMEIPRRIRTHSIVSVGSEYKVNSPKGVYESAVVNPLVATRVVSRGTRHIRINILHGNCCPKQPDGVLEIIFSSRRSPANYLVPYCMH